MAFFIGAFVGGFIIIYLLALAWEHALYQRVMKDPAASKLCSVLAAWITAGTIGGFIHAHGFSPVDFELYFPSAVCLALLGWWHGMKLRREAARN